MKTFVNSKQHRRVIFAAAMFVGALAFLRAPNDSFLIVDGRAPTESDELQQLAEGLSSTPGAEDDSLRDSSVDAPSVVADNTAASPLRPSLENIEASLAANNEIDLDWYGENNEQGDLFEKLVHELRNTSSPDGLEKRARYEKLFLSPQQTQNGSVTLDTLECGKSLCAVAFGGNDNALLNAYAKTVFTSKTFEASAIFQPYWDPGETPGVYRRYIFSHNSEINTVRSADKRYVFASRDRVTVTDN